MDFGAPKSSAAAGQPATSAAAPVSGGIFSNSTPSFSFGNVVATGADQSTGGSIFDTAATASPQLGGTMFGGGTSGGSASTVSGGLFGQAGGAVGGGGMFGNPSKVATSGNMFGSGTLDSAAKPGSTGSPGLFGNAKPTGAAAGSTLFVSSATPQTGTSLGGSSSGLSVFGNATAKSGIPTSQTTPAKPLLGGLLTSTTPAGAPPSGPATDSAKPLLFDLSGNKTPAFGAKSGGSMLGGMGGMGGLGGQGAASGTAAFGQNAQTAASSGLFAHKPGESTQATTSAAPAASSTSNLFGNNLLAKALQVTGGQGTATSSAGASSSAAPTAATNSATSGLFGSPNTSATSAAATSGAGLFGPKPLSSSSAPDANIATTTAAAPAGNKVFGANVTSAPADSNMTISGTSGTNAAASSSSVAFGANPASTSESMTATNTMAAAAQAPAGAASTLGASTAGPTSSLPRLKNKTMDEIITRWATDLTKYQKEFKEQATRIKEWDHMLVVNGEKIQKLYTSTYEAERQSNEIERQLSSVESQQEELSLWLDKYENDMDDLSRKEKGMFDHVAGPDQERERTYKLAEKLTDRLEDMGKDLTKMITEINDMSSTLNQGNKPDDPLSQIVRVLNEHLTDLQWIETNTTALQAKVTAAQKASNNIGVGFAGKETDAAESFYRSYMGRR